MRIENMPGCCTSAVLFSFGEHGEYSNVTVENIHELVLSKVMEEHDLHGQLIDVPKRCIFAMSVDPTNIAILKEAGFKVVDEYDGEQGKVHILTLH